MKAGGFALAFEHHSLPFPSLMPRALMSSPRRSIVFLLTIYTLIRYSTFWSTFLRSRYMKHLLQEIPFCPDFGTLTAVHILASLVVIFFVVAASFQWDLQQKESCTAWSVSIVELATTLSASYPLPWRLITWNYSMSHISSWVIASTHGIGVSHSFAKTPVFNPSFNKCFEPSCGFTAELWELQRDIKQDLF